MKKEQCACGSSKYKDGCFRWFPSEQNHHKLKFCPTCGDNLGKDLRLKIEEFKQIEECFFELYDKKNWELLKQKINELSDKWNEVFYYPFERADGKVLPFADK